MKYEFFTEWFYTHESCPCPEPIRPLPQMQTNDTSEIVIRSAIRAMQAQGYIIQRINVARICHACEGNGRIGKLPRGRKRSDTPAFLMTWTECKKCNGNGHFGFIEFPFNW